MGLRFYNTLSRKEEVFQPLEDGHVRMYTCGPTVYDFAHIGNFRAYLFEDLLRRYLKFSGYQVTQVMNLTDVDDKTIRASAEQGIPLREYTRKYAEAFFEDLDVLRIERAEYYPAATEHVPDMIALVQRLLEKGYAYQSDDGSVYFSIAKFKDYGKLAHLDLAGLRAGARVAQDEYEKENLADFALWKAWDERDGDVAWPSPWGRGRPGWHIECSAMSMRYLGESFDIHTGGIDNIFPHHEDEIAQSEAATGKPFARYWLHCAHLVVDGKKMSKSLGNFHTLRDVVARGYSGREVRYILLATHYRQPLNFTFEALDGARQALKRLDEFVDRVRELGEKATSAETFTSWAQGYRARFREALDNDLNISEALAAVFDMVHAGNKMLDRNELAPPEALATMALLDELDQVLGVVQCGAEQADEEVQAMLRLRDEARQNKNWAEADRL
ncbi:MAG: cysteine--tRNA ligase, partial [Kiritimatiellae bacterium]|nr:cysteine--tRNA ligase [Kiritimatiellia bacterium]